MLGNHIKQVFDEMLQAPPETEAIFFFKNHKERESARVRFILQKTRYNMKTNLDAPIEVSRITGPHEEPGVMIKKVSSISPKGFIKYPGENGYKVYNVNIPPTTSYRSSNRVIDKYELNKGEEETETDIETETEQVFSPVDADSDIRKALTDQGLTKEEIDNFLNGTCSEPKFNPAELEED